MGPWRLGRLPMVLLAATVLVEAVAIVLSWGLEPYYDTLLYAVFSITMAGAGALIASRDPRNAIGWLLLVPGLANALLADAAQGWGLRGAAEGWPAAIAGEWVNATSWLATGIGWIFVFLLFPSGHFPDRRSRVVAWVAAVGMLVALPAWSLSPDMGAEFVGGRNPLATSAIPTGALYGTGLALFMSALVASVVLLVLRFRRARGLERQQIKWFVFAAACAGLILPLGAVLWNTVPLVRPLMALALTALPVAACIAILRYRLYDIDVVISRTVLYVLVTAVLAGAYALTAMVIAIAVGSGSAWVTAGATLAVAAAFRPVRDRLQTTVDRRFNRDSYMAVEKVETFLEQLRAGRAQPEEIEGVLRDALGVDGLQVRLLVGGEDAPGYVDVRGRPVEDDADEDVVLLPISRSGITVGCVAVDGRDQRSMALLPKMVDAGSLAIEIAGLRVELRQQLDEVEASRARIVSAADEERRRIERDLHDGAQQRLVSIGLALRHVEHLLGPDPAPEAADALDGAVAEIAVAIDELRELAGGLRPAHLDVGLAPALRELARRAPLPVTLDVTGDRFAPDVETAAYFTACEGLTNAVKHAGASAVVLSAGRRMGKLVVSVSDDGIGGARSGHGSGLRGLADRVASQGGSFTIVSPDGLGTTLTAEFPCVS